MHSRRMLCVASRPIVNTLKSSYKSQLNVKIQQLSVSAYNCQSISLVDCNDGYKSPIKNYQNVTDSQRFSRFGQQQAFGGHHMLLSSNNSIIVQHRNNSTYTSHILKSWSVSAASSEPPAPGDVPAAPPAASEAVEYIPVPPPLVEATVDPATLNALGEATLSSLGLAGYSPVGLMQQAIEMVHVSCGLPWWGAIAVVTLSMRMLLFPLVLTTQRNAARLNNISPQMQVLQMKIGEAREAGDQLQVSRYTHELTVFMKDKNINPLKNLVLPFAQMPIFISMFIGLRRCVSLPVESFTTGGMLWFTDLTVADPIYALPVITCLTMYLTIQVGSEMGRLSAMGDNARIAMTVMRFLPVICFPFMMNFPAAVLCYWMSTNLVSLCQTGVLRIPAVRQFFNVPLLINHNPDTLPISKKQNDKGTIQTVKDSWQNMKITNQVQDRLRYDEVRFAKAGTGPVLRTFKHDPTKSAVKKGSSPPLKVKATIK